MAAVHGGLLQAAFQNSPAMQSIVRFPETVIVEINDRFTKVLGYTREEVLGKTPFELNFWVSPEKLSVYRGLLESEGMVRDFEIEVRAEGGSTNTVLLSSDVVDIDGVLHSISAGIDLTARKQAEAKLLERERQLCETEARFSTAFQTSPVLMTIARLEDARFVEVNLAFVQLIGLERDQIIGRDSLELDLWVSPKARADFFKQLKRDRVLRNVECQDCTAP